MTAAGCCVTFKDVVKVDNITARCAMLLPCLLWDLLLLGRCGLWNVIKVVSGHI